MAPSLMLLKPVDHIQEQNLEELKERIAARRAAAVDVMRTVLTEPAPRVPELPTNVARKQTTQGALTGDSL
jgi:hypothetical protein